MSAQSRAVLARGTYLARLSKASEPIINGPSSAVPLVALNFPTCPDTVAPYLLQGTYPPTPVPDL